MKILIGLALLVASNLAIGNSEVNTDLGFLSCERDWLERNCKPELVASVTKLNEKEYSRFSNLEEQSIHLTERLLCTRRDTGESCEEVKGLFFAKSESSGYLCRVATTGLPAIVEISAETVKTAKLATCMLLAIHMRDYLEQAKSLGLKCQATEADIVSFSETIHDCQKVRRKLHREVHQSIC